MICQMADRRTNGARSNQTEATISSSATFTGYLMSPGAQEEKEESAVSQPGNGNWKTILPSFHQAQCGRLAAVLFLIEK